MTSHGAAVTATTPGPGLFGTRIVFEGIDMVFAVPYPLIWPDLAKESVNRRRSRVWPSQKPVNDFIADGCTLVPKGSKGSLLEDYEWRISFTGELRLSRSLSFVQREIIHVRKALISEPQNNLEFRWADIELTEKIESFQFLNLLFRESEIIDQDNWASQNIVHMLFHLIYKYVQHLEGGFLSHYFIKTRNILENYKALSDEEKDAVLYTLKQIRINPLEQILQQEHYISIAPESHKVVFSPFVEG